MSFAETENETSAPAGPVASALTEGGAETVGGIVSRTVIVKDAVPVLPCASVALQVTDVVPIGNVLPDSGEHSGVN